MAVSRRPLKSLPGAGRPQGRRGRPARARPAGGQERLGLAEAVEVAGDGVLGAVLGAQVPLEGAGEAGGGAASMAGP
jgi:hypothetical protein